MTFNSPGVDEDIVAEVGPARHEDGRPLFKLLGESGKVYYCEASDIEGIRENISQYNPSSRYVSPPWWEFWVVGGVLILIVAAFVVPFNIMGEQAFNAMLIKLAIAVTTALVTVIFVGLGFWFFGKGK
jgi:hypothetical protein